MKNKKIVIITVIMLIFVILLTGCVQRSTHMVTMRDGINLATDVYLPSKNPNPHGAIFIRTPYNKNPLNIFARAIAQTGWPVIIQDMRGRFASEGEDEVFRTCHIDGPDTLAWIVNQSWSNGKVATWGPSAAGNTQYYIAGANPPGLACQFIQVATPNLHKHGIYQGGQFRYNMIYNWLKNQGSLHVLPELYANENYSLEVWTNVSLEDNWQDINIPAIHIGGWYDCFCQGTVDGFMGYQYQGGPGAQGKSKLIMGPWTHGGAGKVQQGELTYPENCVDSFSNALFWDMANEYTMNLPGSYDEWPSVYYYVMGDVTDINASGNEWREADVWPPAHTDTKWYIHENGVLSTDFPSNYDSIGYTYNPINPVPSVGGQNLNLPSGPYDQTSVENRGDVFIFTSDVLTEPYEATGAIKAKLFVSSDCPDTDFTVKLTDVYPDGRSMLITDGILRMRNREGANHWEFMEPGEIYEVEIDLWSTSYIWNTGHRIRIAISSSNYPRFLANPNTVDSMAQNTTYNIAQNTIYLDSDHPSCIILPQITLQQLNTQTNDNQITDNSGFLNIFQNSKLEKLIQKSINSLTNKVLEEFVLFE
jgi:predicted acyl esterase